MKSNPFRHLGKMERVEWFYNRHSEVGAVLDIIKAQGNIELIGPRKIGKTWFLRYITDPAVLQKHSVDPQHNIFVCMDCQHRLMQQGEAQVYKKMLECVIKATQQAGVDLVLQPYDGYDAGTTFELVLKEMHRQGLKVILLLDEFEALARNPNLDATFFNPLRGFANADDISLAYVTASCIPLFDLRDERESLMSSPFFNIFEPVRLGLFSEEDSRYLVEDSLRRADVRFPSDLLELVLEVGGEHPFFLQMTGHHAFQLAVVGEELIGTRQQAFLEKVREGAYEKAESHLKHYWQKLDDQDQYVLAALPSLWQDRSYQETIRRLKDECLITQRNDGYEYFSPLIEKFVHRKKEKVRKGSKRLIGRTLGSVHIAEKIGAGGMATVYKGYQESLERYVAVKVLFLDAQEDEPWQRFQREAKVIASLQHPNILPIHDFGHEDDIAYIVTDFVPGGTLADLIASHFGEDEQHLSRCDLATGRNDLQAETDLPKTASSSVLQGAHSAWLRQVVSIITQIGEALECAHRHRVLHRDVKPANILMTPDERPLLADFGLVKDLTNSGQLTKSDIIGTIAYMAPEQIKGKADDPRIDIYALGTILYEMVTGRLPFEPALNKLQESPPLPRKLNPLLPVELEKVILKAMAANPEDRYQSAQEMIKALQSVIISINR